MENFSELFAEQQKVREHLAAQLELLSNASGAAFCHQDFEALARLSEAMGMVANSYLVNYGLSTPGIDAIAQGVAEYMGEQIAEGGDPS